MKHLKALSLVLIMVFFIPLLASAQISKILPDGVGIEIGLGHNQLFWQAEGIDGSTVTGNRTALSVMPSARIHYTASVTSDIGIYSFFGYNEFGGRSEEDTHPASTDPEVLYKDRIRFQNLEAGVFGLYRISAFSVGLGAKVNRHLKMTNRSHFQNHSQALDGWSTSEIDSFFTDWSTDGGIRIEYLAVAGITFGVESWFGLSDLSNYDSNIRQNHYRFLLGYRF